MVGGTVLSMAVPGGFENAVYYSFSYRYCMIILCAKPRGRSSGSEDDWVLGGLVLGATGSDDRATGSVRTFGGCDASRAASVEVTAGELPLSCTDAGGTGRQVHGLTGNFSTTY